MDLIARHWNISQSPFSGCPHQTLFYNASGQKEAIARSEYLIANQRRFGVVVGQDGLGKSSVLDFIGRCAAQRRSDVVKLNLLGVDETEFVITLAHALGNNDAAEQSIAQRWRSISDRLRANEYEHRATVMLFDDAHEASSEVVTAITRLSQWNPGQNTRFTIFGSASAVGVFRLGQRLLDLCDLRIEVRPWSQEDTIGYVRGALEAVGGASTIFTNRSLETLHEVAGGQPRRIRQVAELALVAAAGQRLNSIGPDTVHAVDQNLRMSYMSAVA